MPDAPEALRRAAQARHDEALRRATVALRQLERGGNPVSFCALAEVAKVSRSWLYRQPELRAEIERLRQSAPSGGSRSVPASQRASTDSLREQLSASHQEIKRLREENRQLRDQVARRLGEERLAAIVARTDA
ncbi:MAG: DUF6262 family protein [Pseudonocardiaceae bacterium]